MSHCLSAKLSTIVKSLCIARVLRHFVLVPHEICVKKLLLTETIYSREDEKYSSRPDTCLCVALLLQAWLSIPPKMLHEILYTSTSFKSFRCQLYCIIVDSILNRQADYISSSIRLATNAFARRFAPSNAVAGQPGPLLVIRWLQAEKKNHTKRYGSFF